MKFLGCFGKIKAPLSMDVSTGDIITPAPQTSEFKKMFEKGSFSVLTYNIETILAEKVETILSRNVYTTRPRDFYDVYVLSKLPYNKQNFQKALNATSAHRNSQEIIANFDELLHRISCDNNLHILWNNYRKSFEYAKSIEYSELMDSLDNLMKNVQINI